MILFGKEIFLDVNTIKKLREIKEVDLRDRFLPKEAVFNFLSQKDCYVSIYLISLFKEKIEFIDDEILIEMYNVLTILKDVPENVNDLFLFIIKKPLHNVTFSIFMKTASMLKLRKNDFVFIKEYFGYSQIYQYSRNILEKMLSESYSVTEIGYCLILLNHPQLCYKNLLPLFKKINDYASYERKSVLEKGIINVCIGVQAVVLFSPETFSSRQRLLFSIFMFLNNILFYNEFYEFTDLNNLSLFLDTNFYILAILYLDTNSKTTLKGIFNKTLQEINTLIRKQIVVYDDIMYLYSLLFQANMFFWYVVIKDEEIVSLVNLVKDLESFTITKPKYIDELLFKRSNTLIIKEKYSLMNNVSIISEYKLNTNAFIHDIENIDNAQLVLNELNPEFIDWNSIINIACKKENQKSFLELVLQ